MRPCSECAAPIENNDTQCPICGGTQRQTVGVRSEVDMSFESTIAEREKYESAHDMEVIASVVVAVIVALFITGYLAFGSIGLILALGMVILGMMVWGTASGMG